MAANHGWISHSPMALEIPLAVFFAAKDTMTIPLLSLQPIPTQSLLAVSGICVRKTVEQAGHTVQPEPPFIRMRMTCNFREDALHCQRWRPIFHG